MSTKEFVIKSADYHRNGGSGTGFFVGLIEYTDGVPVADKGEVFQIIAVPAEDDSKETSFYGLNGTADIFVLRTSDIAKGNVEFGAASLRGDYFIEEARAIVAAVRSRSGR